MVPPTPDHATRSDAQQRADDIRTFGAELERLRREGVLALSEEQQRAVAAYHASLLAELAGKFDIDRDASAKQLSLGMRIASFLGALAFGASVFYLFYQFWGRLSAAVQVTLLVAASLGSLAATMLLRRRDTTGYFVKLAAMVAFVCFVLNISMLGQIFDITPSDRAFLSWAALGFLLAYACDVRLLLAAGIVCIVVFVSAEMSLLAGMPWDVFGEHPENFFPAAILVTVVPQFMDHRRFSGFGPVYRVLGLLTLFGPMLFLANDGAVSYLRLDRDPVEGIYQMLGFVLSAAAAWVGIKRRWPDMVNTGVTIFVIFLGNKFFDWWWDSMPKYLFFLVMGLTAVLFLFVLRRLRVTAAGAGEAAAA